MAFSLHNVYERLDSINATFVWCTVCLVNYYAGNIFWPLLVIFRPSVIIKSKNIIEFNVLNNWDPFLHLVWYTLFIGFARVSNFSVVWYESWYYFSKHGLTTVDSVTIRKRQGKDVIYASYLYASNLCMNWNIFTVNFLLNTDYKYG